MRRLLGLLLVVAVGSGFLWPASRSGVLRAQDTGTQFAAGPEAEGVRGPRFLYAVSEGKEAARDARDAAVLKRRVSLRVTDAPLTDVLDKIAGQTGLNFTYSRDLIPGAARVSLRAEGLTVAAVLTELLIDVPLDVVLSPTGTVALVRREVQRAPGAIVGRVTDAKTGDGLAAADVYLEGTRWRTRTGEDGRYRLTEVEAGSHTLAVRRIGYAKRSQAVTVASGEEVTVDVALEPVPTQLNEIVTTATGDQRRVELGHVVGRINADSLVKEAPVSSLSELLTARVPGVRVFQGSGVVGGDAALQIRGPNSLLLRNEPVVVIDGVRYTNTREPGTADIGLSSTLFVGLVERGSPLNHLNVNDIESVEVVKGPSAATLYGTDAANGVIVITTKRGQAGPPRWSLYATGSRTTTPKRGLQDGYWGWGTVNGVPNDSATSCTLELLASGVCTQQDSVTVLPNPLTDPALSVLGAAPRYEYGLNVAGGPQALRYYVSADFEDAGGPIQMPRALVTALREQRALRELPKEWREPNALTRLNLRTNLTAALNPTAELRVHAGYAHGSTRSLRDNGTYAAIPGLGTTQATGPYAPFDNPIEVLLETSSEETERVFGSGSGQWRPAPWLALRATVGLDLNHGQRGTLTRRGDRPNDINFQCSLGCVFDERLRQLATTAELGATATARTGRLSWRTSAGAQYVRTLSDALGSEGFDLTPGGTSILHAAVRSTAQTYREAVTLGSYLEETVGLNDRLFLTGALRVDGASTFGHGYDAAAYPKVNASWLVSEEPFLPRLPGLEELRLRYAFGASGQQPDPRWAGPQFVALQSVENGQPITIVQITSLGNPALRPERVREHEFGVDATALGSRLGLELTWTRRRTVNQIAPLTLEPGLFSSFTNLGLTTQRGFEAQLRVGLVESRLVRWEVTLQHSVYRTRLEDLGGGQECYLSYPAQGCYREGYPLGTRFDRVMVGYTDANGDGIIDRQEVQYSDTLVDVGLDAPPRSQTLTSVLGLFEGQVRLSAVLERNTGFTQFAAFSCGRCRAQVDPSTPLEAQARSWGTFEGNSFQPGDHTRLLEVSAAVELPRRLTAGLGVRAATLVLSARNLALWSHSSVPDPGVGLNTGFPVGIPLGRTWGLRVNVGL